MRIVQILNSPNWSGASNYCVTLSACLQKRGHELLLLTEPGKPLDRARQLGIPCDDTIRLNHRDPYLYVHAMKRMMRVFRDFNPDVISSHINEGAWMAGLLARHVVPRAAVIRTRGDIDPPKGHFINRYVHHAWTDHLIVSSNAHKRICRQILAFPEEHIDVVYGAIDPELFHPRSGNRRALCQELGIDERAVLVTMVARLDPVKGHEFAIQALKLLKTSPVPVHLLVLGYESNRTFSWLEAIARENGIRDHLHILGYRADITPVIASSDIGLITSTGSEANCRAALEHMACGKPLVATNVGVIPEILLDGEHGFLVNPKDPMALATALSRLAVNPLLRAKMGQAARENILRQFNLNLFTRRTEEIYQKVITRKQPPKPS